MSILTAVTVVAALATRSRQPHSAPAAGRRTPVNPVVCTYQLTLTSSPFGPSLPIVALPFSGTYALLDGQGRFHEIPFAGTTPFTLSVAAQAVAFVVVPDEVGRIGLELRQVAASGCTWDHYQTGVAPTKLMPDPKATPNAATRISGFRAVSLPGGVSSSCDTALLNALPWPTPPPGVPVGPTAPSPCPGSNPVP